MNTFALTLAGALTLTSSTVLAQSPIGDIVPFNGKTTYAGVYDAATGTLTPGAAARGVLGDPIYNNSAIPPQGSFFYNSIDGRTIIDEGRIPTTTSTGIVGLQDSYDLSSLRLDYVTDAIDPSMGGTGMTVELKIYESFAPCGLLETTDAPIATILLAGLPGSTAMPPGLGGFSVDVDLTSMNICMRGDGDGVFDGAGDTFGWSFEIVDGGGATSAGPFIRGDPDTQPAGDGTVFQNAGAAAGTGLDTADLWRQINADGSVSCFFFGGYPANIYSSFALVLRSGLTGDCIGCGLGDDRFEENDTDLTAAPLDMDTYGGLISDAEDDWYSYTLPPNSSLVVDLTFIDAVSDLDLVVRDAATGNNLGTGFTSTDNESVTIGNCDLVNSLDVLIFVDNFGGVCNDYSITLGEDPLFGDDGLEDNDECLTAVPLPIGTTRDLIVRPYCGIGLTADDHDYYSITLADGDTLTVDVLFTDAEADIDLVIYDTSAGCPGSSVATGFSTTDNENGSYTNNSGGPLDMVVRVDWFSGGSALYDLVVKVGPATIGEVICLGDPNSVGDGARICAVGSDVAADNDVTFDVTALPTMSMGYFLVSQDTMSVNPAGSEGTLCIASLAFGRYAFDVLDSGATGTVSYSPNLTMIPIASGGGTAFSAVMAGDTYNHQYWYRDLDGMGMPTSNFSDAISIEFN